MRIAFIIYNYSESKGGVERYAYNLAEYLSKEGDEIHIFCHRVFEKPGSERIILHTVPSFPFYSPLKHLFFARNVARVVKEDRFDIIHGFGRTYSQDIYRVGSGCHWEYLKSRYSSMDNIVGWIIQYLNPRNRIIMNLEKKSFTPGAYKKIICISNRVKEEIKRYYNVPEEDIKVIYNGVDLERFNIYDREKYRSQTRTQLALSDNKIVLLFVGSGFERKGLRYAMESIALVPQEQRGHLVLLVIGKGNINKYKSLARKYNIEHQILFMGAQTNIASYYYASDIFLFPTLYEPFGNVCLEAMASGLPVITTRIAGVSEIMSSSIDSFVVENPSDTFAIAEKIRFLLDKVWRENMGRAAYLCASKYSMQNNFKAVKEIYKEIIC
jgi:UDP-glucose:(heptosyl)LPS alpha-1,3-glucosyltransferase